MVGGVGGVRVVGLVEWSLTYTMLVTSGVWSNSTVAVRYIAVVGSAKYSSFRALVYDSSVDYKTDVATF